MIRRLATGFVSLTCVPLPLLIERCLALPSAKPTDEKIPELARVVARLVFDALLAVRPDVGVLFDILTPRNPLRRSRNQDRTVRSHYRDPACPRHRPTSG